MIKERKKEIKKGNREVVGMRYSGRKGDALGPAQSTCGNSVNTHRHSVKCVPLPPPLYRQGH